MRLGSGNILLTAMVAAGYFKTIKEVTKPIEFITIMKQSGNTITATADINISRANWNIDLQRNPNSWNPFDSLKDHLVDDDIQVNLELVFKGNCTVIKRKMKNYSQIYTLFLMFVFCTSCKGQGKTDLQKDNTKSETKDVITSTVPNNITRNIIQDRKGNIWIAAFDGVFRYDGKSFTNITSKVSSARFFSLLEDRKGNFWFGSIGSGVYYYDGKSFRNYTTKEGLPVNSVTCIYEDKTGNIWFATGGGASRYDGKSFRNYRMNEGLINNDHKDNDVNSIIEDKTGKFWFGTGGNACVYNGKTFTILTHNGKPFTNVRSIIEDKKGNIWLGGKDGLWRYDGSTFTNLTENFVGYVYEDKKGNIWTSSEAKKGNFLTGLETAQGWVLSGYDEKSLSDKKPPATAIKPEEGMIFGILEANDGSIWFGALNGVYRYNGNTITDFKGKQVKVNRFSNNVYSPIF